MARPIPPHGSEARYQGATTRPGCRCRTCIDGWTRAGQKRLLARLAGRPATVAAQPVTWHIALLHASDMTTGQIAAASGVDASTVRDHARGALARIRRTTAEKILAVQPHHQAAVGHVPSLASIRRCRALYAAGHAPAAIAAAHPKLQLRSVEYILQGVRRFVSVANHNAIAEVYKQLATMPGSSDRARARAAVEGWAGPAYWDEEDFDNPHFDPATAGRELSRNELAAVRREEIEHLARFGFTPEVIHQRLGGEVALSTVRAIVRELQTGQRRNRTAA